MNNDLILASASPARAALLRSAGLRFRIQPSEIREPPPAAGESLRTYLTRLARIKTLKAAENHPRSTILAADTVLCMPPMIPPAGRRLKIIGKPSSRERGIDLFEHAVRILEQLAGREHIIGTGVYITGPVRSGGRRSRSGCVIARVRLRELTDEQIRQYIDHVRPWNCAGAYALQGMGASIISHIRGDPTTIIGLPMEKTMHLLSAISNGG